MFRRKGSVETLAFVPEKDRINFARENIRNKKSQILNNHQDLPKNDLIKNENSDKKTSNIEQPIEIINNQNDSNNSKITTLNSEVKIINNQVDKTTEKENDKVYNKSYLDLIKIMQGNKK
jgi:hypothetical protein